MLKAAYSVTFELKNITAEEAAFLDVINIAFAHCRNGVVSFDTPDAICEIDRLKAINPDLKILFSVGGWGSGGFSVMSRTEEGRERFARSCLETVKAYHLDGIDIDWEYPCLDWANIDSSPEDKENFTKMLAAIRNVFSSNDPSLMLTIAVGNDSYFTENTEMDKVAPLLDYVSLMTYDMRGCGDSVTGHHTNLYPPNNDLPRAHRSVVNSVEVFTKAGVPIEKLVVGLAFYSRMWKTVECSADNGLWQKASSGDYGPSYHDIVTYYLHQNGFVRYYDHECEAPYLFNGETFISYDDEESIAAKCRYVKENGLLGVMYWEHSCDKTRTLLFSIED